MGATEEIPAIPPGVHLSTLGNGLTLILKEDHSAPVVSVQAWCRAGSVDEGEWLGAGLSHVLEHMLFKGTSSRGPGRIDQEIQEIGGYLNAYTSFDRTVFWVNAPSTGAAVAIDVLCDVMQNATLPEDELAREMEVIRREMDMCHDDPGRRASRRLFETAYTRSPCRFPVIGCLDIFSRLGREDILAYYRAKYVPNNIFFVVVGDILPAEVAAQFDAAVGKAKARPMSSVPLVEEPRQVAPREVVEEDAIELAYLHFSWHVSDARHPDTPALEVLSALLGAGRSSRLYQRLRQEQGLVSSIEAWTCAPGNSGLLGMSAVCEGDKFPAACDGMLTELDRMKKELVGSEELAKAVKQFTSAALSSRKTMHGQAQELGGNWMVAGDLNFSERFMAAVRRLTPEDLRRVANAYLAPENRTLYALAPWGAKPRLAVADESLADHPVRKYELANKLRLLVKESHRLPFVEFRVALLGGVMAENEVNNGVNQLLARMLLQGTERRTAEQIAREIESVGGHIDVYGGNNSLGIDIEVLSSDFAAGLETVAEVLLRPAFPADALEREREVQLAGIKAQKDQMLQLGVRALRRTLYGNLAYGLDPLGTESSVADLRLEDVRDFHSRLIAPESAVIAVYGDVDPEATRAAAERAFADWGAPSSPLVQLETIPFTATPRAGRHELATPDKKQAIVLLAYPGAGLRDPDRFALDLLQEACSDLGSRLCARIRDKLGLAYYVGAQNFLGLVPGYFCFYAGTAPETAGALEQELLAEVGMLRCEGLTEAELRRAKAKIVGHKKIARQDLGSLAHTVVLDELYGLGYANVDTEDAKFEAVELAEVQAVAARYLDPEKKVIVTVRS